MFFIGTFHRDAARSFVDTSNTNPNGRTLPLRPHEVTPAPNDHIYTTPNLYDVQNQAQITSFSADADVIPRLGTLKSQKRNYMDRKMDPESLRPVPVSIPKPGEMQGEEFYDRVYEDGYDRPKSIGTDLRGETGGVKQVYTDGYDRPRSISTDLNYSETPVSSSVKTESVMDEVEAINIFAGTTIPRSVRGSGDMAVNPLYDPHIRSNI